MLTARKLRAWPPIAVWNPKTTSRHSRPEETKLLSSNGSFHGFTGVPSLTRTAGHGQYLHPNVQHPEVIINKTTHEITYTGTYYHLAHFSKFVRPDAIRLQTTGKTEDASVMAFRAAEVVLSWRFSTTRNRSRQSTESLGRHMLSAGEPRRSMLHKGPDGQDRQFKESHQWKATLDELSATWHHLP